MATDEKDQDKTLSNPEVINSPARTGGPMSAETTTADREAKTDLKPIGSMPFGDESAEDEIEAQVQAAMREEHIATEATQRVAARRAQMMMASINTDNPYQLKEGEKPVYQVGGNLVDPDGARVEKVSDERVQTDAPVIDPLTQMKQM